MTPHPRPTALYRHFDARGELLYVGVTVDPVRRWAEHLETSIWARFAAKSYVTWHPTQETARQAERDAILWEDPVFNTCRPQPMRQVNARKIRYLKTGNGGGWRRVPCKFEIGAFCVTCGPDAERWFDERTRTA